MTLSDCCSRQAARPSFAVEIRPCGQRLIFEAHGEIDLATTPRIHEVVAEVGIVRKVSSAYGCGVRGAWSPGIVLVWVRR